jgi:site-specific recombinase XerD
MKYIVVDGVALSRPLEGPLAAHIGSFARWSTEQGYSLCSLNRQVLVAACFSRWLGQKRVGLRSVSLQHAERYLRYRARRVQINGGDAATLKHLIELLRREGVIPAQKRSVPHPRAIDRCAAEYERYLREERLLAAATILSYLPFVRCFLKHRFGNGTVRLSRLCPSDIVRFVQRQAHRLHPKRAKLLTSALRSFLHYVRYRGEVTADLAAAVPIVANWSMTSLPRAIEREHVHKLLSSIDRRTPIGLRDYAILLVLSRLGLRSGEVAFLELDDIDWNVGRLSVHGKSGRSELPLSAEVGKAIAIYLRRGRPVSTSRRVFLRARAPIRGFRGASGICSLVRHSLKRAGINGPHFGAHQFRHGLATEMLRQGASLSEIGELLRHRHPQTTTIYAKVDINALRTLALPWPGGVR